MLDFTVGRGRASFGIQSTRRARKLATPEIITADTAPSGTLYHGENAADNLAGISTFTDTGNFASSANGGSATIVSAAYQVNGSTVATNTVLSVDDVTSILVTDSEGNARPFLISTVIDVAPVASGGIADQSYPEATAISSLDVGADFTGTNLVFALDEASDDLPPGLSLNAGSGQITGTPATPANSVLIVVEARNSQGSDTTEFLIAITEAAAEVSDLDVANMPVSATVTMNKKSLVYWMIDDAAPADYGALVVGGGDDSGSEVFEAGPALWTGWKVFDPATADPGDYVLTMGPEGAGTAGMVSATFNIPSTEYVNDFSAVANGTLLTALAGFSAIDGIGGNIQIQSGELVNSDTSADQTVIYDGGFGDDHFSEITIGTKGSGNNSQACCLVRATDNQNFYRAQPQDNSNIRIIKVVGGTTTNLELFEPNILADGVVMRFEIIGTALKLYIDDVEVWSTNDSSLSTGYPGLRLVDVGAATPYSIDAVRFGGAS
ncbi:putative Ig domain-containing protein [Phaeobacter sp. 22II1-1F12B]|uniref:putative Ig domain-containing protein n=1 Tax=Phaeobacter sp. 22II1-1F12B TaxID=1317111 RepID=UPI000B523C2F|nr:putative Ig domain-containing protein [Phaeobacter sp. 22II1-1F12B]OWU80419.1 hypothetical protein ATO1_08690 [Phaeobacter sp. 22II1-1F12B]